MHRILVDYLTGDSFSSYEVSDVLEWEWTDEKILNENIAAILEHDEFCQNYENDLLSNKERERLIAINRDKFWFADGETYGQLDYLYVINLKLDDGKIVKQFCSWRGIFEKLYFVRSI